MSFLAAVRTAALPATWSQGVKLARDGAVLVEKRTPGEVTARVRVQGKPIAPTVVLYIADEEWACDCGDRVDPCAHVAAAAITADKPPVADAATDAPAGPERAPASAGPARVAYDFSRHAGTLFLERALIYPDGREEPLTESVLTLAARADARVVPTHDDIAVDRLAVGFDRGVVLTSRLPELLRALEGAEHVRLDGIPMRASREPVAPDIVVEDGPEGGVVIRATKPASVREVVAAGIVRVDGDVLRPLAATELTGEQLERLPVVRKVAKRELGDVATRVLPGLERYAKIDVRTSRVPGRRARIRPRLSVELDAADGGLSVLPLIVYGDPPVARVDGASLTFLGAKGDAAPVRDEPAERELVHKLRDEMNLVPGRRVRFDGAEAARFVSRLRAWGEKVQDRARVFEASELVPRVTTSGDTVEVWFEQDGGASDGPAGRATAAQVVWAARQGLDVVPLEGGGFAPLPRAFLDRHGAALADLLAATGADGKVARAAAHVAARFCEALELPTPPAFAELRSLLSRTPTADSPLPADLAADLRPYQREGVAWLTLLSEAALGGILADDMGLGKTVQTLAALRGRALVVCPTSLLFNWAREIERFRPSLRVSRYHGAGRKLDATADVTLTSYGTLRVDVEMLARETWDAVVLDEAQAIKNPDSQAARAAYQLRARLKLALSGTPVENRLEELFSLMHFANPGLLGARSDFRARFDEPIAAGDASATARLREIVRPFVLRRVKRDVAPELPPRTEDVMWVELSEDERAAYDTVRAATQKELVEAVDGGRGVLAALEALLRLRQAACHSGLLPGREASTSSKVERLAAELVAASESGHKALVFSQWTGLLDRVEPALAAAGLAFTRLDGSTRDREAVVERFQSDGGPPVLLLSLKAGGTGLNLTAADHVFLLDPWWNPAAEDQAADRAHRIGQDKPVFVHRLVARDTVEERVLALQDRKRALVDAALGDGAIGTAVTREEMLALLA